MRNGKAKKIAYMGVMLSLIIVLSLLERLLPPLPMAPPGVNLGLSNIIIMYCSFFIGIKPAFGLAALKSIFVAFTRAPVAGYLSLCGGLLSVLIISILLIVYKRKISYVAVSICGAVAHNMGQVIAASAISSAGILYYIPALIVMGIIMGIVTGITLTVLLPVFHRIIGSGWNR